MMADSELAPVLGVLGAWPASVAVFKDVPGENGSWLVRPAGAEPVVLRRYHLGATRADLAYEHAVLRYLTDRGWIVPQPLTGLAEHGGSLFCLTRYVPGAAAAAEDAAQQERRGRDLAGLHLALRGLSEQLGQRVGWRPQHYGVTTNDGISWQEGVRGLAAVSARLADWAGAAADLVPRDLMAARAGELPVMVIHGDFASWNVHYDRGRLAGVIDFGLTHLDSRPYELAIARTHRAPGVLAGYRAELTRSGWPLTAAEAAAIEPVYRAFRLGMVAWALHAGRQTGRYDLPAIERALVRTGTPPP